MEEDVERIVDFRVAVVDIVVGKTSVAFRWYVCRQARQVNAVASHQFDGRGDNSAGKGLLAAADEYSVLLVENVENFAFRSSTDSGGSEPTKLNRVDAVLFIPVVSACRLFISFMCLWLVVAEIIAEKQKTSLLCTVRHTEQ
ncbi:uncharacterized protein SPSK_06676 [Sporothrix schenckii 1099-18]|uniref:Uncharacterized protein n=1 Tax=Sporothrix schenckii 1099-18 TaxID=1397361 RepID=A0A0F2MKA3_SPOSC|nr:uncharacterized protein SPSK_06676 [Sporothrix schenckii 1099-18]KJR89270.1 hypothetical protein SPSK_06676 [Sporothrix schenckii 1099-18]